MQGWFHKLAKDGRSREGNGDSNSGSRTAHSARNTISIIRDPLKEINLQQISAPTWGVDHNFLRESLLVWEI